MFLLTGVLYRRDCSLTPQLPYWLLISAGTPFLLLTFIKAVNEDYYGLTTCRLTYLVLYFTFLASTIVGKLKFTAVKKVVTSVGNMSESIDK